MAWYSSPAPHASHSTSLKLRSGKGTRSFWRWLRGSHVFTWCLCFLVLIFIVLWPSSSKSKQNRSKGTQTRPRPRPDEGDTVRKPLRKQGTAVQPEGHLYRTDGLLDVDPQAKHPILELIDRSETLWERKVERQSKTFKQAVDEYRRRYKRSPPKGFEIWWDYVDFHGVKLVDEYDSIHDHLQPFWGVEPSVLRSAQAEWESYPDTFTIGKLPGKSTVEVLNHTLQDESDVGFQRLESQVELLEEIQEYLPDFRATFTMQDIPQNTMSWEMRKHAEEAAARGEYVDVKHISEPVTARGWAAACPPNTPIHSYTPLPLFTPTPEQPIPPPSPYPPDKPKSFIYNHRLSMSPCFHPTHLSLNGFLSQYRRPHQFGPNPIPSFFPTFSICVSPLHSDILTSAPEQFIGDVGPDPPWSEKVDERLLWRGRNTGILHQSWNAWNSSQRIRFVEMATRRGGETRVLMPRGPDSGGHRSGWDRAAVGYGDSVRTSTLNAAFMDVAFVGKPIQCREPVCKQLESMFEWRGYQPWQDAWMYKYIMDIDGNGWSARFKRLMTSNSLIFKSTIFPEWFTERIMPWVHYVPVQVDLSDLYDILAFFRGDISNFGGHDDLAERIATAGKKWSQEYYRQEDMTAYHFRLFLEYARVMSLDREAMSYKKGDEAREVAFS